MRITSPAKSASYRKGQRVRAEYACTDGAGGPGIAHAGCLGSVPSGAVIDTDTLGRHAFTVRATSTDGLTSSLTVEYTVLAPPATIAIKTTTVRVSTRGTLTVTLTCSRGSSGCAGSLTLDSNARKIASARFTLAAGHRASVKVTLTNTGRRLLVATNHHQLKVRAVARIKANTAHRTLTLTGTPRR